MEFKNIEFILISYLSKIETKELLSCGNNEDSQLGIEQEGESFATPQKIIISNNAKIKDIYCWINSSFALTGIFKKDFI